ncbi:MAG: VOC family protein [Pseudomonadales bacterium]|nr:VOC family protein [Pseudomonadales bacterium]
MQILEHIHVNVDSIEKTAAFLRSALPELACRGSGDAVGFGRWAHFGDDNSYIALTEVKGTRIPKELRHIGLVVEDIDALMTRLAAAGYDPADPSALNEHPYRRRVYYIDGNGLDWEFIQYLTDNVKHRNDYSQ